MLQEDAMLHPVEGVPLLLEGKGLNLCFLPDDAISDRKSELILDSKCRLQRNSQINLQLLFADTALS